ncbi:MAG: toprim domain-containing protein [Sulfurovum sp.]|nr:toprim domain-containing protein [Sulfurovum sp.]
MRDLQEALEFADLQGMLEEYAELKYVGDDEVIVQTCPKCFNEKWKLYINTDKKVWFCQSCQWGKHNGDFCSLLAALSGKNKMVIIQEILRTVVPSTPSGSYENALGEAIGSKAAEEAFELEPIDLPGGKGLTGHLGSAAAKYLKSRGVLPEDVEKYELRLSMKLRNSKGPWAVFPVLYYGLPVACQGRKFLGKEFPKYMSTDKISNWMWPLDASNVEDIESQHRVVLVEGVFDALGFIKAGVPALCTFGKNLSRSQIKLLQAHKVVDLHLGYDADAVGDMIKTADRLKHLFHVHVVEFKELEDFPKADPGDVLAGKIPQQWLTESFNNSVDTKTDAYWEWKFKKEMKI